MTLHTRLAYIGWTEVAFDLDRRVSVFKEVAVAQIVGGYPTHSISQERLHELMMDKSLNSINTTERILHCEYAHSTLRTVIDWFVK